MPARPLPPAACQVHASLLSLLRGQFAVPGAADNVLALRLAALPESLEQVRDLPLARCLLRGRGEAACLHYIASPAPPVGGVCSGWLAGVGWVRWKQSRLAHARRPALDVARQRNARSLACCCCFRCARPTRCSPRRWQTWSSHCGC